MNNQEPLLVLNYHDQVDYEPRPTVKGIILNDDNQVLIFNGLLPGGGIEKDENMEEALKR